MIGVDQVLAIPLGRVAAEKYGGRLAGFEVDVPAEEYLRFDND